MSKELIEQLRACAEAREQDCMTVTAGLLRLAADALESKAAPVGEREALDDWYNSRSFSGMNVYEMMCMAFQAGAAYQRAKQPQSAEEVV